VNKPDACLPCPFYGNGRDFVPDEIRENAPVYLMAQNPHHTEIALGRPLVGKTGMMMESKFFPNAGLTREDVSVGNTYRCLYQGGKELPPVDSSIAYAAMIHCAQAHFRLPSGTRVIVAQGDYAARVLTGTDDSTSWRGYVKPLIGYGLETGVPWVPGAHDIPVLITMHLARLFREPKYMLPVKHDWTKIPRLLRRTWPRVPPKFVDQPPHPWPQRFAFDTEFPQNLGPGDTMMHRFSMSWGVNDGETCVVESDDVVQPRLAGRPRVITQYAPADIYRLARVVGIAPWDLWSTFLIEDTMVKHATLHADHPHDLNFLGSIWASINRWKHLAEENPQLYAGCDALGTLEVDMGLEREFEADSISARVYREIDQPAHRVFVEAQRAGIATNPQRITEVVEILRHATTEARQRAQAAVGWPMNVGSASQVGHQLYTVEGIKKPRGIR